MKCQKCKKVLSERGPHFVCQGACQGTFHRNCVNGLLADMKAGKTRYCCNNCEEESEDEPEESVDVSKAIKDILKKVSVLPGLEKQLDAISLSMSVLSEKYDTLLAEHEQSKERIVKLEKVTMNTQNKCIHLEKCNVALQQKVEELEQATRKHKIEITGVEQLPSENVMDIVAKVGRAIDVSCADIESAARAHPLKPGKRPAPIIVAFKTTGTESRDKWLAQRRKLMSTTSGGIVGGSMTTKIYINEDLTHASRVLLWNAKQRLRASYKYIWVSKGKILVKKTDDSNAVWVKTENDLLDLVKVHK